MTSPESVKLTLEGARQLSDMANSVAGFAITSNLLLIFACLKDIGPWVRRDKAWFFIGIGGAFIFYAGAVCLLHYIETTVSGAIPERDLPPTISTVSTWLLGCRLAGIFLSCAIAAIAVIGTSRNDSGRST